ncbi:MAG: cytochrome C biogenesis protein [Ardenticatenia bacterium]|nr:MAG: cytochrome C biogenesis protein [Ardenticatenia bacterium]
MMHHLRKILAIVAKDLAAELRTREMLGAMFVFALLVIFIFNFAFELRAENQRALAPGVLWVAITFSGMLGLSRSFIREKDRGSLEGLLLAPVDRGVIFLGKMLGNALFIAVIDFIVLPVFVVLFNIPVTALPPLAVIAVLGTIGLSGVGTLFSAMAVHTRAREVLLPVLLFPLIVPVILSAVKLSAAVIDNLPFAEAQQWLSLLLAFDIVFAVLSFLFFDYVVEE